MMSSIDVNHEIACLVALAGMSRGDVVERYGAEVVETGIRDIEFMCKFLRAEKEAMSRHSDLFESARRKAEPCVEKLSNELDSLQIFLLFINRWYPDNLLHLLYLKWRNGSNKEYIEYADEIAIRIKLAQANQAFESVLSGARSAAVLDIEGLKR